MDITKPKRCSRHNDGAGAILPASSFYVIKNRQRKEVLSGYCKDCGASKHKTYRADHKEELQTKYNDFMAAHPGYHGKRYQRLKRENPQLYSENIFKRKLSTLFKTTVEWYEEKLKEQGGHCALCPATLASRDGDRLVLDHHHGCCPTVRTCGKCLRGLLCHRCNSLLERLESVGLDWPERARKYLEKYRI